MGLLLVASAASVAPAAAQEPRREPISIDYVGVEGVYLPVGADRGLVVGDTLVLHADASGGGAIVILELTSVARRRSVGRSLSPEFQLTQDAVVYLALARAAQDPPSPVSETVPAADVGAGTPRSTSTAATSTRERRARLSGRFGLDLEARETLTSWEGDLFGETRRRFATPVGRLSLRATDLPGGLEVRTLARASYRYTDGPTSLPATSIRIYDLTVVKPMGPAELRLGRFHNPYEPYSAYWDGALLRVGGRRVGMGVVAGFDPVRANEGFSADVPKFSTFTDLSFGGRGLRYDTDLSLHIARPDSAGTLAFAGWTQRVVMGALSLDQRLRVDRSEDGAEWSVADLRVRGALRLGSSFTVHGGYARSRAGAPFRTFLPDAPVRREGFAGVSMRRGEASFSVDAGRTAYGDAPAGWSVSTSSAARIGRIDLYASARRWTTSGRSSVSAAPVIGFPLGPVTLRTGYGFYRTKGPGGVLASHTGDLSGTLGSANGFRLTLRAQQQWGSQFRGTRIVVGIWRSF
jgi:hypothetical protein